MLHEVHFRPESIQRPLTAQTRIIDAVAARQHRTTLDTQKKQKMVNYSKWDNLGDSSDDEAPSRLAQDVQTKLAVAPPEAPPRRSPAGRLSPRRLIPGGTVSVR